VDDLCHIIPFSRRRFEIRFKEEMGKSVYQFILNYRIEQLAQLMLLDSDRTMLDLACEVGFNDIKNLSRVFKKYKGLSPNEFRQKYAPVHDI
jgi:LacI family transcriptional regulator